MQRFFIPKPSRDVFFLSESLSRHIAGSLRMKPGDRLLLCDGSGAEYTCVITETKPQVFVQILQKEQNKTEPSIYVRLYQALPKGDKFSTIVQKAVELGVSEIIPVISARCVARPDEKTWEKKRQRYQAVALEAAQQAGRGKVPEIKSCMKWSDAILKMGKEESLLCYECGDRPLSSFLSSIKEKKEISVMIGSEGGFEPSEIKEAQERGIYIASLGRRILRCETAPLAVLSILMYETGNFDAE